MLKMVLHIEIILTISRKESETRVG